ncbi:hypothetical protein SK128_009395, partial [Halocaridina rubra]
ESGYQDITCDEEEWDRQEDQLFEPAGEMQVTLDSSDSEDGGGGDECPQGGTKHGASGWKKILICENNYC